MRMKVYKCKKSENHVIYVHQTVYVDIYYTVNVVKTVSKDLCMCCDINLFENNHSIGHMKTHTVQKPVNQNRFDLYMPVGSCSNINTNIIINQTRKKNMQMH